MYRVKLNDIYSGKFFIKEMNEKEVQKVLDKGILRLCDFLIAEKVAKDRNEAQILLAEALPLIAVADQIKETLQILKEKKEIEILKSDE
ncbi:MAG: hypothetical protein ACH0QD_13170 [Tepidibacillus sp.]